jgi:hypothetical protein
MHRIRLGCVQRGQVYFQVGYLALGMGVRAGCARWAFRTDLTLWPLRTFWACGSRCSRISLWTGVALRALDTLRSLWSDLASAYGVHPDESPPLTLEELAFPYVVQEFVCVEDAGAEFGHFGPTYPQICPVNVWVATPNRHRSFP